MTYPNYYPYEEDQSSTAKGALKAGNQFRKWSSKLYKFSKAAYRIFQLIALMLIADMAVAVQNAVEKSSETDDSERGFIQTASNEETTEPTEVDAAESVIDIFAGLSEMEAELAEALAQDLASGKVAQDQAIASARLISSSATTRALNASDTDAVLNSLFAVPDVPVQIYEAVSEPVSYHSNAKPTLEYESAFNGSEFVVTLSGFDVDGDPPKLFIDGVETDTITFTPEQLAAGNLPIVKLEVVDIFGLTATAFVTPPALVDDPGNDAPQLIPQALVVNENQSNTFTIQAYDPEDGTLSGNYTLGPYDHETNPNPLLPVHLPDSEGLAFTDNLAVTLIDDHTDHKVDQPLQFVRGIYSGHVAWQETIRFFRDVVDGQDFAISSGTSPAPLSPGSVMSLLINSDQGVLYNGGTGGTFSWDADTQGSIDWVSVSFYNPWFLGSNLSAVYYEEPVVTT